MAARAFPGREQVLQVASSDTETIRQLQMLLDLRVVTKVENRDDCCVWSFTEFGASQLRVASELQKPENVFAALSDFSLPSLEDASTWQLVAALKAKGFQVRQKPKKKTDVERLPPHTAESVNLVWYVSSASVQLLRPYMIALLRAESLFAEGVLLKLHHCQLKAYYAKVLEGHHSGSPLQALADDVRPALELDVERAVAVQVEPELPAIADTAAGRPKKRARQGDRQPVQPVPEQPEQEGQEAELDVDAVDAANSSDSGLASETVSSPLNFLSEADSDDAREPDPEVVDHAEPASPAATVFYDLDAGEAGEASVDESEPVHERVPAAATLSDAVAETPVAIAGITAAAASPDALEAHDPVVAVGPAELDSGPVGAADVPPPSPAEGAARRHPQVHADSFMWRPFRFTWSSPAKRPKFGSWQATCPYHKASAATGCKKAIGLRNSTEDERVLCRDLLKVWCLSAASHDRQRSHKQVEPRHVELLDNRVLEARLAG